MTMQTDGLAGRRAVITGAGRGLGAALAIALAEAGSSVVLCGRNPAGLSDTAAIIRERTGSEPRRVALDLADPANVEAAGRKLADGEGIDILINNGAMWLEGAKPPIPPRKCSASSTRRFLAPSC